VDRYVTLDLLKAVAEAAGTGRHLVVATTDLDRQETVLWDMGLIAKHGDEAARRLFRDVLLASASIPGIYPPVLIRVEDEHDAYDELHADGSITTSLFAAPLVTRVVTAAVPDLAQANVYLVVNGQLAVRPRTTPLRTSAILASSFSAALTYKMREDIAAAVELARRNDMHLLITEIPVDYAAASFIDFDPVKMRELFSYGQYCAGKGLLWLTPEQSLQSNLERTSKATAYDSSRCPAELGPTPQAGSTP
jgi:predicted acylesterase/phospholipase RssA